MLFYSGVRCFIPRSVCRIGGSIRGTAAAALLLLLYNGERSRKPHPKLNKAFYAAYPLHLVVIWAMVIAAEGPLTQLKLLKYYL